MKLHLSLDVNDLNRSIEFYSILFGVEPAKHKPGYAKFDVAEPAVVLTLNEAAEKIAKVTSPNHMGVRVAATEQVLAVKQRLEAKGISTIDEMNVTCCYAVQDKIWAQDPTGYRWEVYVFKGDAEILCPAPNAETKTSENQAATVCCAPAAQSATQVEAHPANQAAQTACCAPMCCA